MPRTGSIVRWNEARGFGFIRSDGDGAEVFVHARDIDRALGPPQPGTAVVFEQIHVGGKGPRAMAVRALAAPVLSAGAGPGGRGGSAVAAAGPRMSPQRAKGRASADASYRTFGGSSGTTRGARGAMVWMLVLVAVNLLLLVQGVRTARLGMPVLLLWPVLNLATFWLYWHDKNAAQRGDWRTPENTLHAAALAGGWLGAWWAQQVLRHKSRKADFRAVYWGTTLLHLAALGYWVLRPWA